MLMLNDEALRTHLAKLPAARPFTTAMARAEGVPVQVLAALVAQGLLRRPVRSVYLPVDVPDTLAYRLAALELMVPPGCFVTDHTAAWLHAGDIARLPNAHLSEAKPDIFRHSRHRALRHPLVRSGERMLQPDHLLSMGNIEVTTPIRTACDIGRLYSRDVALWGLDSMLGLDVFDLDELNGFVPYLARQRGVVQLRVLSPLADGGAQSFGESALRLRWHDAGLPRPRCQVPVVRGGRAVFYLDMGHEDLGLAAEYDGEEWHTGAVAEARDDARRESLRREEGWWIEVFRRSDVFGHAQEADLRLKATYALLSRRRAAA